MSDSSAPGAPTAPCNDSETISAPETPANSGANPETLPADETIIADTRSPWETPDFAAYLRAFNADAKRLGDSNLEPPLRRYFDRLETQQARDAAEIRAPKSGQ